MYKILSVYQTWTPSSTTGTGPLCFPERLEKRAECLLCKIVLELAGYLAGRGL